MTPEPQQAPAIDDRVLDAKGMEQLTGIPASWFLEQARQRKLPHLRAGKYVRFRAREVLLALQIESRTDRQSPASKIAQASQQLELSLNAGQPS